MGVGQPTGHLFDWIRAPTRHVSLVQIRRQECRFMFVRGPDKRYNPGAKRGFRWVSERSGPGPLERLCGEVGVGQPIGHSCD